ncbi:16S rRNA (guanine(527)-N(7))-methyltransferase RsmG [Candidatus Viridilinea mediisalina]|uniref:Ribosomal RNA small subunit methyltransferase G n=1 Tax=Candidatus Viridilinea mediisalina TaxID=2024553 RepID=A0A2A6RD34_9CHLR|nr:16S rRNA (guanine(527)-N(7))-methyltransferase RsmG [Candidatus Viridilinea mediisalina]PDV99463.1 16S rRNA (guanine(527)-N(7))-methyltransferase RsmG [Candidatus Viridilinea mediisalina]
MTDSAEQVLLTTAHAWGLQLDAIQLAQFADYAAELVRWNAQTNLTAITEREAIYVRHFLDSLALATQFDSAAPTLVDLGSGAGFPGIPLKLLYPNVELLLVESVGKKTAFLQHIVNHLGLSGVRIHTGRAESLGHDPHERERHSLVTARAVADLRVLAEYGLPLLRLGGLLLAPKGSDAANEAAAAAPALAKLGGRLRTIAPVALPGLPERTLVVIEKLAPTDPRYPRSVGMPARRPL